MPKYVLQSYCPCPISHFPFMHSMNLCIMIISIPNGNLRVSEQCPINGHVLVVTSSLQRFPSQFGVVVVVQVFTIKNNMPAKNTKFVTRRHARTTGSLGLTYFIVEIIGYFHFITGDMYIIWCCFPFRRASNSEKMPPNINVSKLLQLILNQPIISQRDS